jgi:acylphosphatase
MGSILSLSEALVKCHLQIVYTNVKCRSSRPPRPRPGRLFDWAVVAACATLLPTPMSRSNLIARRYFIRGRVQGVGYRYFVQRVAEELHVGGYARNLDDGRVEVYAVGAREQLSDLAGLLWKGPRFADVRGVEEQEAGMQQYDTFHIEA